MFDLYEKIKEMTEVEKVKKFTFNDVDYKIENRYNFLAQSGSIVTLSIEELNYIDFNKRETDRYELTFITGRNDILEVNLSLEVEYGQGVEKDSLGFQYTYKIDSKKNLISSESSRSLNLGDESRTRHKSFNFNKDAVFFILENVDTFNSEKEDVFNLTFDCSIKDMPALKDLTNKVKKMLECLDNKNEFKIKNSSRI